MLVTVVETREFIGQTRGLLTEPEIADLISHLARHPDAGDIIRRSGGVRKLRWRAKGKGKRGGARVVYFFQRHTETLYLLTAFSKSVKIDLTEEELQKLREIVKQL